MKNTVILKYLIGSLSDYEWKKLIKGLSGNKTIQREIAGQLRTYREMSGSAEGKGRGGKSRFRNFETDKRRTSRMLAEVFDSIFKNDRHDFGNHRISEIYLERIKVSKSIYLLQLLSRKDLPLDWLRSYVTSLIETCDANEFIEEKITLQRKLVEYHIRLNHHEVAESLKVELASDLGKLHDVTTIECLVNRYVDDLSVGDLSDPVILDGLVQAVELSTDLYTRSKLEHLAYYNRLLGVRLMLARHDFLNAHSMLSELNEFCASRPLLYYSSNLTRNYRLAALVNFLRLDFRKALDDCSRAGMISTGNLMEMNQVRELEALSLIYLGEYAGAVKVLEEMIAAGPLGNNQLQSAKRHYFLAYALFLSGETRKSFMMLQHTVTITKHDESWNFGVRLLHIFLNIYAGRFDVADSGIESLRKFLQRTAHARKYPSRIHLIFRLMVKLSCSAYVFSVFLRNHSSELRVLSSGDDGCIWKPGGFEVIPINRLFESSMDGKKLERFLESDTPFVPVSVSKPEGRSCF